MRDFASLRSLVLGASLAIAASACSGGGIPASAVMPDVGVPLEALNTDVRVWAPAGLNAFKVNEPIDLAVEIIGTDQVIFPRDYGNRMFVYADGHWSEVENVPTDWGEGSFLLSPSNGDPMEWGLARVFPWLDEEDGPILMRIFVIGTRYRDSEGADESVGGFLDVELKP